MTAPLSTEEQVAFDPRPRLILQERITKRELFAAMAMQAILTGAVTRGCPSHEWFDQRAAVDAADALLSALEKHQ